MADKTRPFLVGIDLGTTFSAVATLDEATGMPRILPDADGEHILPSVLYFEGGKVLVGREAERAADAGPEGIVAFIKREMGDPDYVLNMGGKDYRPAELSSYILKKLKADAEAAMGRPVDGAVVTVPAYFAAAERQDTWEAASLAGLNILGLVNEPTAAAMAHGVKHAGTPEFILVYDLGGGTFDCTLLRAGAGEIQVLATDGEDRLGGVDWDDELVNMVAERFTDEFGEDPREDVLSTHLLRRRCREAKHQLSVRKKTTVQAHHQGKSFKTDVSREEFETATRPLLEQTEAKVKAVLQAGQLEAGQIAKILLVGGMTRMPQVHELINRYFPGAARGDVQPDEAVAMGAAVHAANLHGLPIGQPATGLVVQESQSTGLVITDVLSHSLGMEVLDELGQRKNSILLARNQQLPAETTRDRYTTSYDNQTDLDITLLEGESLDPDECQVLGYYTFSGIPPRPAGQSSLAITFKYDRSGLLEVSAKDVKSGIQLVNRISRGEAPVRKAPVPWGKGPWSVFLLVDCSRSMKPKMTDARQASLDFVDIVLGTREGADQSREQDEDEAAIRGMHGDFGDTSQNAVGLVTFGLGIGFRLEVPLTQDAAWLKKKIHKLKASGQTFLGDAIGVAGQELEDLPYDRAMIIVTDGVPNNVDKTRRNAELAKKKNIRIITIGIGDEVNQELLDEVSSAGDVHHVSESTGLVNLFRNLAVELAPRGAATP